MQSLPKITRKPTPSRKVVKQNPSSVLTHVQKEAKKQRQLDSWLAAIRCGCRL